MITCQHEWVKQCQIKYRFEPLPEGEHWEDAHYPTPECLDGTETIRLWSRDHTIHGILQTLNLNHPCMHGYRVSWDTHRIQSFYPEYAELHKKALSICGRAAGLIGGKVRAIELNKEKDTEGKSMNAVKGGQIAARAQHALKDEHGKSVYGKELSKKAHAKKDNLGRSVTAVKAVTRVHVVKDDQGRSVNAVAAGKRGAAATNSQKWVDPNHPELGEHSAGTLSSMQRKRGYPHGKENRVRVG
jgi:hypothetical protein